MILGLPSEPIQEIIAGGTGAISAPPFHFNLAIVCSFRFAEAASEFSLDFFKKRYIIIE
jgi:hypothetical protein